MTDIKKEEQKYKYCLECGNGQDDLSCGEYCDCCACTGESEYSQFEGCDVVGNVVGRTKSEIEK